MWKNRLDFVHDVQERNTFQIRRFTSKLKAQTSLVFCVHSQFFLQHDFFPPKLVMCYLLSNVRRHWIKIVNCWRLPKHTL